MTIKKASFEVVFVNGAPCRSNFELKTPDKNIIHFYNDSVKKTLFSAENILLLESIANFLAA